MVKTLVSCRFSLNPMTKWLIMVNNGELYDIISTIVGDTQLQVPSSHPAPDWVVASATSPASAWLRFGCGLLWCHPVAWLSALASIDLQLISRES
jgi:hypothetical protein